MAPKFDRKAEDLGNVVGLEHVNVMVPDQRLATLFYIVGLGLTRDPYLVTGVINMWVNVGRSQFHLPVGDAQVLRGRIGMVMPDLEQLAENLEAVRGDLDGTRFDFTVGNDAIDVTCPWGNRMRCHAPDARFGPVALSMAYLTIDVPAGTSEGIGRFYSDIFGALVSNGKDDGAPAASVTVGDHQKLVFRETDEPLPDYDGHHIQLYVANFSGGYDELVKRKLITQESNQHQYRFLDIFDPASGDTIYQLEHEIRSMTHPLYGRPMINRNPAQTNRNFVAGYDDRPWARP
jgi:hypothetical protein